MNTIKWPLNSYGTINATVRKYDADGVLVGDMNIGTCGVFFSVRDRFGFNGGQLIFRKSLGSGISLVGNGTAGGFIVTIQSSDVNRNPSQYAYEAFIAESGGTAFSDGTTQLRSVGSGIFEIMDGVKYGTT